MIAARLDWEAFRTAVRRQLMALGQDDKPMPYAKAARQIGIGKVTLTRLFANHTIEAGAVLAICQWMGVDPFDFVLPARFDASPAHQPKGAAQCMAQSLADIRARLETQS